MDEFRFSEVSEVNNGKKKKGFDFKLIFIIIISIVVGLSVFFVSNALFGKKTTTTTTPSQEVSLDIDDNKVVTLYNYVTYGQLGTRNNKYISQKSVKLENFSNYEKFYYAMMLADKDDFKDTGKTDHTTGLKVYSISNDIVKKYMKQYFGEKVTYSTDSSITTTFGFSIDDKNTGTLNYDVERDAFLISFDSSKDTSVTNSTILPYYTELDSATNSDDGIEIVEKIIYVTAIQQKDVNGNPIDKYDCLIYKDYNKTMLIGKKLGVSSESVKDDPITPSDYSNSSNVITYKFKKNYNGEYYFYSSEIRD